MFVFTVMMNMITGNGLRTPAPLLPAMYAIIIRKDFIRSKLRKVLKMSIEGDIVLIHYLDKPTMYARIEKIEADIKKDWYQVTPASAYYPHANSYLDT